MTEKELLLKKLLYRSTYRGCRETDALLGNFFQNKFYEFDDEKLKLYQNFIEEDDALIYDWLMDKEQEPLIYKSLVQEIKNFHCF